MMIYRSSRFPRANSSSNFKGSQNPLQCLGKLPSRQTSNRKWAAEFYIPCRNLGPDLQPLLSQNQQPCKTRPRSKSKPDEIFIHPAESNIARADAVALELGLGGNTERVTSHHYHSRDMPTWETGKGRDVARQMLAGPAKPPHSQRQSHEQFFIGKGSDSDSD